MTSFPQELSETEIRTFIKENPQSRYKVLAKEIPYEKIQVFLEQQNGESEEQKAGKEKEDGEQKDHAKENDDNKNDDNKNDEKEEDEDDTSKYIRGVWFEKEYKRNYPYKTLASAVIGSTTSGNLGMAGLENYYNSTLNGTNGRQYGYLNSDNAMEKTI